MKNIKQVTLLATCLFLALGANAKNQCQGLFNSSGAKSSAFHPSSNHSEFLFERGGITDSFPMPSSPANFAEISAARLDLNKLGNQQTLVGSGHIEIADESNAVGFTALRYSEAFHRLADALRISDGAFTRTYAKMGEELKPAVGIMSEGKIFRMSEAKSNEVLANIEDYSIQPGFLAKVQVLEILTGVQIDLKRDLKYKEWGLNKEGARAVIAVEDFSRILNGFAKPFSAETLTAEQKNLVARYAAPLIRTLDTTFETGLVITAKERTELLLRLQSMGVTGPLIESALNP
jgi:hypothetical protein